jgi:hypothetical protein
MSFNEWLIDLFKDERGVTSIKPVVTLIGTLVLASALVVNIAIRPDLKVNSELLNTILLITVAGMGADTVDKFTHKKPLDNTNNEKDEQQENTPN